VLRGEGALRQARRHNSHQLPLLQVLFLSPGVIMILIYYRRRSSTLLPSSELSLQPAWVLTDTLYPSHFSKQQHEAEEKLLPGDQTVTSMPRPCRLPSAVDQTRAISARPARLWTGSRGGSITTGRKGPQLRVPPHTVAARAVPSDLPSARFKVQRFSNPWLIIKVGNIFQKQIWI